MSDSENAFQSPTSAANSESTEIRPRLWPAVLATASLWIALMVPTTLFPESPKSFGPMMMGIMGSYAVFLLWWIFLSRVPWSHRLTGLALAGGTLLLGNHVFYHPSVPGLALMFILGPWIVLAITAGLLSTKLIGWRHGKWIALATALIAIVLPASIRFLKVDSAFSAQFQPRWESTNEERLIASLPASASPSAGNEAGTQEVGPADWPGFRGAQRDGHVFGGVLAIDWDNALPKELWRRSIGPGWGSFCVVGELAITQEQRGPEECVVAYESSTGEQVWSTGVEARFEESVAGPGPRGTPTFHAGSLLVTGAAGDVLRLDASSGEILWQRKLTEDTARKAPPMWGFASSPLVVTVGNQQLVLVYAGNPQPEEGEQSADRAVIAYDFETGEPVWNRGVGWHGYSSPHLATLGGVEQVLMSSNMGLESFDPATGDRLWLYEWSINEFPRSTQPLVVDEETVVLSAGYDSGTISVRVTNDQGDWSAKEIWKQPSRHLEPYFNDMVLYEGHLYGIHKKYLVCINLESGEPTWPKKVKRKTKFGNGQLVLDPTSGMLLVTTETSGEVLLIEANPETLSIRGRFEALEPDTNWNHPVVAGGRLYLRNGEEAACFELPVAVDAIATLY